MPLAGQEPTGLPPLADRSEVTATSDLSDALAGFFDADWYLSRYPDIVDSGHEPLQHFVRHGAAEGRDPNRFFDGAWYLANIMPDVASQGSCRCCITSQSARGRTAQSASAFRCRLVRRPSIRRPRPTRCCIICASGSARGWLTEKPIAHQATTFPPKPRRRLPPRDVSSMSSFRSIVAWRKPALPRIRARRSRPAARAGHRGRRSLARTEPVRLAARGSRPTGRIELLRNRRNLRLRRLGEQRYRSSRRRTTWCC